MKEVELYGGCNVEKAWQMIKDEADASGEVCFAKFNDKEIRSTDTLDEAYQKVTGKTKAEFEEAQRKWHEDYEAKRKAHMAKVPELIEHYKQAALGVIPDDALEEWDSILEVRLTDIYRGMELDQVLDCARVMKDETLDREARLRKAYKIFQDAGHSGWSAGLTMSLLRRFCPDGYELADACNEFRYDPDHKTTVFIARNPDGQLFLHVAYPHWGKDHDYHSPNEVQLNPLLFPEIKPGVRVEYKVSTTFDPTE